MTIISKCPYCNKELNGNHNICPHCGGVILEIIGHKNPPIMNDNNRNYQNKKNSVSGTSHYKGQTIVGNIIKEIRYIWNSISPNAKFFGFIVLILIVFGMFSNNTKTSGSANRNIPKKSEEIILPENKLSNGTVIYKDLQYLSDDHQITIDNSFTDTDAIVKLVSNIKGSSVYTVYIRKGYKYTISNISNGSYSLYFAYCRGYNYNTQRPLGLYGSQKVDRLYSFQTRRDGDYLVSSQLTITLYKEYNGNLTTTTIGEDQFNDY